MSSRVRLIQGNLSYPSGEIHTAGPTVEKRGLVLEFPCYCCLLTKFGGGLCEESAAEAE